MHVKSHGINGEEAAEVDTSWTCPVPGCHELLNFLYEDMGIIDLVIVEHLVERHDLSILEILAYDPSLKTTIEEAFPDFASRNTGQ